MHEHQETPERPAFGTLLKHYRLAAGLSQEQLAERAGLSADAISALERAIRRAPYRETVQRVAAALGLAREDAALLHAAVARGRRGAGTLSAPAHPGPPSRPQPASRLPAPPTPLIGREREVAQIGA